jgi:thioredoxin 1
LTTEDFEAAIKQHGLVLVDFWADWCEPCKILDVILEELQQRIPELYILKVDADESAELKKQYHMMSVPVLLLFKDGELLWRMNGFMMTTELEKKIREIINSKL